MKRVIALLLSAAVILSADAVQNNTTTSTEEVNDSVIAYAKSFNDALLRANAQNKPVMFIIDRISCRWCEHFKRNTLSDPTVIKAINRDFVPYMTQASRNDYPADLRVPGTPGTWFLKPDGIPLFQPLMGSIDSENIVKAFAIVLEEYAKVQSASSAAVDINATQTAEEPKAD